MKQSDFYESLIMCLSDKTWIVQRTWSQTVCPFVLLPFGDAKFQISVSLKPYGRNHSKSGWNPPSLLVIYIIYIIYILYIYIYYIYYIYIIYICIYWLYHVRSPFHCFHSWGYLQIIPFNSSFHYKPSIYLGYPYFCYIPIWPSTHVGNHQAHALASGLLGFDSPWRSGQCRSKR